MDQIEKIDDEMRAVRAITQVCSFCWQNCFSTEKYREFCGNMAAKNGFNYSIDTNELMRSAQRGCPWCRGLSLVCSRDGSELQSMISRDLPISLRVSLKPETFSDVAGALELEIHYGDLPDRYSTPLRDHLLAFTTQASPASTLLPLRPLRTDFASSHTIGDIKRWLDDCLHTHIECRRQASPALPTRLIDLEEPRRPRLITTTQGVQYRYAALSYCWGSSQRGVLLKSNIANRLQILNVSEISQTAIDAISLTSRLGIRWLWIDAMCIIQDDEQDKEEEIAAMCSIYRNAILTLAATNCSSASETFLESKVAKYSDFPPPAIETPIKIPFWVTENQLTTCSLQSRRTFQPSLEPVNLRAWTLQEFLLSARIVSFASHTIYLTCSTESRAIDSMGHYTDIFPLPMRIIQHSPESNQDQLSSEILFNYIIQACTFYSRRRIGLIVERLTAFGGIAELLSQHSQQQYLAGLWAGADLVYLLYWNKDLDAEDHIQFDLGQHYIAPTWSWMSFDRPISWLTLDYDRSRFKQAVKFLSHIVTLKSPTLPYGRITDGYIKAHGVKWCGFWHKSGFSEHVDGLGNIRKEVNITLDRPGVDGMKVHLFMLFYNPSYTQRQKHYPRQTYGLVLTQDPMQLNRYRRIGTFVATGDSSLNYTDESQTLILV